VLFSLVCVSCEARWTSPVLKESIEISSAGALLLNCVRHSVSKVTRTATPYCRSANSTARGALTYFLVNLMLVRDFCLRCGFELHDTDVIPKRIANPHVYAVRLLDWLLGELKHPY